MEKLYDLPGASLGAVTSWFNHEVGQPRDWKNWTACPASASNTNQTHYWIWSRGAHDLLTIEATTVDNPGGVSLTLSRSASGPC
jgi:hypothetical protein